MIKHWSDRELQEALKDFTIIADTREQVNGHITKYFEKQGIPCVSRKIDTGDYSACVGALTLEKDIVIERKHNLDEICGNFTTERERFEREFLRAKAYGTKVILIIENATLTDIYLGNYRSKVKPQSLLGSLFAWMVRYNITVLFSKPEETGKLIHGILYYAARELLVNGKI